MAGAVRVLTQAAAQRDGRVMLGICADDPAAGVAALKQWVGALGLPRGALHGMDKDGVPLDIGVLRGDADAAVEQLHLCGRGLGPLSAQLIGGMLRTNRTLRALDLSGNAIGDDGASALLKELGAHRERTLTSLNLANNGRISSRTAKALAALVELVV